MGGIKLNVLIVDDEYLIRDGLARSIDWATLGFDIVDIAEHGLEALEMIEKTTPDLILTDVRMPFMDGLELIKSVKVRYPEICVIIISGHEEFSYAKTALQLDAFDYILKPINLIELELVIKKAILHINLLVERNREIFNIKNQILTYIPILKERFILDIIFGKLTSNQISSNAVDFGFNPNYYFATAFIEVDDFYCDSTDLIIESQKMLEMYFENDFNNSPSAFICNISTHEYLLLLSSDIQINLEADLNKVVSEILEKGKEYSLSLTISTGAPVKNLNDLLISYENALLTSNGKFMSGGNRVLFYSELEKQSSLNNMDSYDITDFKNALIFSDKSAIMVEFKKIRSSVLLQKQPSKIVLQLLCFNIFFECRRVLQEQGAEVDAIIENPIDVFQKLVNQPSYEIMFDHLESLIIKILDYRDELRFKQYSFDVDKAKKFIKGNYKDVSLSLKSISKHINMSACYFSVIFKKETGITYINYLTNIRVEKAKDLLLNSDLKVYEVAYEVGYDNPTYFSTLFKKLTGISPFDYKKQILTPRN
jgi:two-component system, response regulator YesN